MEQNYMVETARCPKCNALCINGHDDDGHIFCAKCRQSFVPKKIVQMSGEEYARIKQKVSMGKATRYECSAWTAYDVD